MTVFKALALLLGMSALAACSSYSPALNPEPTGRNAVYELEVDQAKQIVSSVMAVHYSPSGFTKGRVTSLPPPAIGYIGELPPFTANLGWTTTVVITPVTASVDGKNINAVRIEVTGSTTASPIAGNILFSKFKAHLKSELDNSGSLRFVDHYVVRSLPAPSPVASQAPVPPLAEKRTELNMGTGFAVLSRRTLVTAFHVVDGAKVIEVVCAEGVSATGIVEKIDPANDLALILISAPASGYLEMSAENSLTIGQKVFTMGFPVPDVLGYEAKYSDGSISSLSGIQGAISLIQTTVPIQPGNSGGPLSDESGKVVGVVTSTAAVQSFLKHTGTLPQNINWAVKSEYLHPLLSGISQDPIYMAPSAIERVQKSVCLIKAYN
jgi:S1-C subfamily serine protease